MGAPVSRRGFLGVLAGVGAGACTRSPRSRELVLAELVREVAAPDVREVVKTSEGLASALEKFSVDPSAGRLKGARSAWKACLLAWKRAQCFRTGPLVDTSALLRACFWPTRTAALEAALASQPTFDAGFVEELGADLKGLYALEHLLFSADEASAAERFRGEIGAPRRTLAALLARNVAKLAAAGGRALGDGKAFAQRFAAAGTESVGLLVSDVIMTIEALAVHKLDLVVSLDKNGRLTQGAVEGGLSASSHELVAAQLLTTERLYRGGGGGIAELVAARSPGIVKRIDGRYDEAVRAVRGLTAPLEALVRTDRARLVAAIAALKALEVDLKLEAVSALGLTLAFPGGDGD